MTKLNQVQKLELFILILLIFILALGCYGYYAERKYNKLVFDCNERIESLSFFNEQDEIVSMFNPNENNKELATT